MQASGIYEPSFTSRCLENVNETGDVAQQERLIQGTAANLYTGKLLLMPIAPIHQYSLPMFISRL